MNIERETKLSGKIHEKAVLILSNYLGSVYAVRRPISLAASLTRITSYNVCYTKLLRISKLGEGKRTRNMGEFGKEGETISVKVDRVDRNNFV